MSRTSAKDPGSIPSAQIAAYRLQQHHLDSAGSADAVTTCRDVCGVQAQVMSAAYLQLWARNHALRRKGIEETLRNPRTLVKTSLMRQTLHIVPSDEFMVYIAAVRSSRIAGALRIMSKFGIDRDEADNLTALILEALASGPLGRSAISAYVRPRVSKRVRRWMELVWSILRLPVAEGLVCYGSGEGNQVTFIRADQWLPRLKAVPEARAQIELLRKYLRAYGPATVQDFVHWAGIPAKDGRRIFADLRDELREVTVDGAPCFMRKSDIPALLGAKPRRGSVRLLPLFDPFLLAHAQKSHLVETLHYKRVYRNQGWISAVLLVDGKIGGTWSYRLEPKKITMEIEPFKKLGGAARKLIEQEAESLASFFGKQGEIQYVA